MALYVYRCRHCGAEAEAFRASELRDRAHHCDACGRWSGRRVLSAPAIRGETVAKGYR